MTRTTIGRTSPFFPLLLRCSLHRCQRIFSLVLPLLCLCSPLLAQGSLGTMAPDATTPMLDELAHESLLDRSVQDAAAAYRAYIPSFQAHVQEEPAYQAAIADLQAENWNLADAAFARFTQRYPHSVFKPYVAFARAEIAFRQHRYAQAHELFVDCLRELSADSLRLRSDTAVKRIRHYSLYWNANSLMLSGKYEEAQHSFEQCAADSSEPYSDDALFALGQMQEARAAYAEAIQLYQSIENSFAQSTVVIPAKIRRAQCLLLQRENSNALTALASAQNSVEARSAQRLPDERPAALDRYYNLAAIHFLRGEAENQGGQCDQAVLEFDSVLADNESSPTLKKQAELGKGWSYLNLGRWQEALSTYDGIIDSAQVPESHTQAMARLYRCVALKKMKKISEARHELTLLSSSAQYSQVGLALLELGQLDYEAENYDAARRALERASHECGEVNSSIRVQLLLGAVYMQQEEWKKAIGCYQSIEISLHKGNAQILPQRDLYLAEMRLKHGICCVEDFQYREGIAYLNAFVASSAADGRVDEAVFWLAEAFYRAELMKNAEESYQKVLTLYGASSRREEAYYGLGWTYFRTREFDKANQTFTKMLSEFPDSRFAPDAYVRKGDALYLTKNYIEAAKAYKEAYKINPKEDQGQYAQFQIGQSLYRAKDYATAITQLHQFVHNFPKSVFADHALYTIAYIYTLQDHNDDAITGFKALIAQYPQSDLVPASMYYMANSYYAKGDFETAIATYRSLMETFRSSYYGIEALRGLQESLSVLGRNDEAIEVGKEYMASNPDGAMREQIQMKTIEIFLRKGDYTSAAKEYQDFLNKYPDSDYGAEALYLLAKSQMGMNDIEAAQQSFSLLFSKYPKSDYAEQGQLESALLYLNRSNMRAADSLFQLIVTTYPNTELASRSCYERAQMQMSKSDTLSALTLYQQSASMLVGEYSYQSLYRLAMYYRSQEKNDTARQYFTRLTGYTDNTGLAAEAQYRIGELYITEKNYDQAALAFEAVKSKFDGVEDWYTLALINLGECYEKLQYPSKAKEVYQTVIILHPADDYGKTAQSRLKRLK